MNLSQDQITLLQTIQDLADDSDYTDDQAISEKLGWKLQLVRRHLVALKAEGYVNITSYLSGDLNVRLEGRGHMVLLNPNYWAKKPTPPEINFLGTANISMLNTGQVENIESINQNSQSDSHHLGHNSIKSTSDPKVKFFAKPEETNSNTPQSSNDMLSFSERTELVTLLLAIPSITDRTSRATIMDELPPQIKTNIVYSEKNKTHVLSIVKTCLQYPNGMEDLEDILLFFEGDSIPMQRFKEALNRLLSRG
ncbi:MAG: effector-associated domain 2-containing protein [Ardenticatenaceae bacterium]